MKETIMFHYIESSAFQEILSQWGGTHKCIKKTTDQLTVTRYLVVIFESFSQITSKIQLVYNSKENKIHLVFYIF